MTTWDASFEASPADSDEAKYGANKIRELKTAVSERLELEMNFKTGTRPLIKAGQASVCLQANTTDIANIANMSNHAIAWDTTLKVFKGYNSNWVTFDMDHGALSGKSDDDHPQYLSANKANQTIEANISCAANVTIDGIDIDEHANANAVAAHTGGVGVHTHANDAQGGLLTNYFRVLTTTYTGTKVDDREIDIGVDLANATVAVVVIKDLTDGDSPAVTRTGNQTGDQSFFLHNSANALYTNRIQSFTANGFTIGDDNDVNKLNSTYQAIVIYQA